MDANITSISRRPWDRIQDAFTYKMPNGEVASLSVIEKVAVVALFILGLPILCLGPLLACLLLEALKKRKIQQLTKADDQISINALKQIPLQTLLDRYYKRHPILGDGNCYPRAIANGLGVIGLGDNLLAMRTHDHKRAMQLETEAAKTIRANLVRYERQHPVEFRDGVDGDDNFDTHTAKLEKDGTCCGDDAIYATSEYYHVCIWVFKPGLPTAIVRGVLRPTERIYGERFASPEREPIYLYNSGNHYTIMTRR